MNISEEVHRILEEETGAILPDGAKWDIEDDVSQVIDHELDTLLGNGLSGIVIVLLILAVFLGWRVSLMTAIGLPFSYLGLVLALHYFGINFNLISLVAMILVVGILVDDAIIVAEEYCQQLPRAKGPREAAISAVTRVAKPILGMVATTSVAFAPLLLLESDFSWILYPLPVVVISALFLSLFESFFLLPNHLAHFIRPAKPGRFKKISEAGAYLLHAKRAIVFYYSGRSSFATS